MLLTAAARANARPLDRAIPELFSAGRGVDGELRTTLVQGRPPRDDEVQRLRLAERFRSLGQSLAVARSQLPVPTASGAFAYRWDPNVEAFVRQPLSLGSTLAERASTLGRGVLTAGVSYTRADYDTLDGEPLDDLNDRQAALSAGFLAQLPPGDAARHADDVLETHFDVRIRTQLVFFAFSYGFTENVDVGAVVSLNRVELRARAETALDDTGGNGSTYFAINQPGVVPTGQGVCRDNFRCARDRVDDSATGTGDVFLRTKWRAWTTEWADLALAATFTIPTGNANEFLGFHSPTFTPQVILSKAFGRWSPHINASYSMRSKQDASAAQWLAGGDVRASEQVTLYSDFLGYHTLQGTTDNVFQSALGMKLNLFGSAVISGGVQLPLNREGLRSDVIWTIGLEYSL